MQHHFDVELAKEYGILESILLDNFCFWTSKNVANGVHIHDGHVWTYNSVKAFAEMMPYASPKQIRSALSHLEAEGLIITGNFNKSPYDRTKWYALTDKALSICRYENFHLPAGENGSTAKGGPIPDNYTYTDTDFYTDTTPLTPQGEAAVVDADLGRVADFYQQNIGTLAPSTYQQMQEWLSQLSADVLILAMQAAVDQGKRNWAYIRGILKRCADNGIKTAADYKAAEERHSRPKQQEVEDWSKLTKEEMDRMIYGD